MSMKQPEGKGHRGEKKTKQEDKEMEPERNMERANLRSRGATRLSEEDWNK